MGLRGGGFLYTNKASVSLGLVVSSEDLSRKKIEVQDLQTKFRMHPAVQRLLRGGKVVEYSAHLVPELGAGMMPQLWADGVLVAGDAAGFLINNGYTFRGVDLAIASGIAAGEAAEAARNAGGMTKANLAAYEKFLRSRNVLTDLERFRRAPLYMKNERLFDVYPRMLMEIAERMYTVDGSGKERLFDVVLDGADVVRREPRTRGRDGRRPVRPPDRPDPRRLGHRADGVRAERDDPEDWRVRSPPLRRGNHGCVDGPCRSRHRGSPGPPADHLCVGGSDRGRQGPSPPHGGGRHRVVADDDALPVHGQLRLQPPAGAHADREDPRRAGRPGHPLVVRGRRNRSEEGRSVQLADDRREGRHGEIAPAGGTNFLR